MSYFSLCASTQTTKNAICVVFCVCILWCANFSPNTYSAAHLPDFKVVMHCTTNCPSQLSRKQLKRIYLQGTSTQGWQPITLPLHHYDMAAFSALVIGLTPSRIQSYWTQLRFTGRGKPPVHVKNYEEGMRILKQQNHFLFFVPQHMPVPQGTIVLYSTTDS